RARMAVAGFDSPLDYYYYLRYDDRGHTETAALVELLVVGETYLFREAGALAAAVEHVVRPAVERRGRASIWCAATASGEEPVTLGMLLADAGLLRQSTILATDVSERALARARTATFGRRSARALQPDFVGRDPDHRRLADRWLVAEGDRLRARAEILAPITFRRLNLVDAPEVANLGTFDLVLCRNVLIYFADETVRVVVTALAERLAEGGRLLLGASESLLRLGTV